MQHTPDWADSVFHLFVITTKDRELLIKHLESNNINPGFHYPIPCHLQNAYKYLNYKTGDFPFSEYLADHCISLPMFPELTNDEVDHVINAINNLIQNSSAVAFFDDFELRGYERCGKNVYKKFYNHDLEMIHYGKPFEN
jgi:dTDP-4-amino-4,6-dideoxygalactose transaminase